jgi:hypothetical protein
VVRFFFILAAVAGSAFSQDYRFSVPEYTCNASLESDGTLLIYYEIEFDCEHGAHEIDIIDIGFPTDSYERSSVSADIDGSQLDDVRESSYIPVGVEVHLGDRSIQPGHSGQFRLSGRNPGLVYRDYSAGDRASVQFSPTWFDGSLLTGSSHFVLRFQFPPGADSASVMYFGRPFTRAYAADERMVYEWEETRGVSGEYLVGVSFPSRLVTCTILETSPTAQYTTPSGGGGGAAASVGICFVFLPVLFVGLIIFGVRQSRRRRLKYMPPSIGVEGVGIKRGLSAPQASMLLEQPLDKVLRLIVFGLFLKDVLRAEDSSGKPVFREGSGDRAGLWDYEKSFLGAVKTGVPGKGAIDPAALKTLFVGMVKDLETRMKGFSVRETRDYYRSITAQAWKQLQGSGKEGEIEALMAGQLEWLLLDPEFEEKAGRFPPDILVFPARMGGSFRPLVSSGGGLSITRFCSDVAGSLEHFAGGIVGSFEGIASSVTAVTNPIPVSSYSSGRSGGGCACACACAGCACACAGGGR